jgi:hypothetical protein
MAGPRAWDAITVERLPVPIALGRATPVEG